MFEYHRPPTIGDATTLLRREGAVALSGGTDLMVAIRHRTAVPTSLVDLKSVHEIGDRISVEGDHLRIGGRVVMSRLSRDERVNRRFPSLAKAASVIGSVQIRNRATLAGNLCHGSPAADTPPPLLAHAATVAVSDGVTSRTIALREFFVGPGATVLERGEVVTAVDLPIPDTRIGSAFARVTRRRGVDLASVSVACVVEPSGRARFGFGAVGPTPLVAESTVGELDTEEGVERLLSVTNPISDVRAGSDYRDAMLRVHVRRVLAAATDDLLGSA